MIHTLAYRPFLDPIDLHGVWYLLLLPIALFIALAYKAVRCPTRERYPREVAIFFTQILVGIVGLGALAYVVIVWTLPIITPMPTP